MHLVHRVVIQIRIRVQKILSLTLQTHQPSRDTHINAKLRGKKIEGLVEA